MATTKQKQAARKNLDKARQAQQSTAQGSPGTSIGHVLSTAEKKMTWLIPSSPSPKNARSR